MSSKKKIDNQILPFLYNLTISLNAKIPPLQDLIGCLAHDNQHNPL